jgi:hypothetical protein
MANPSYQQMGRLSRAKAKEFNLVSSYKLGYRNREDITNLPPGVLIVGSKNVLTNVSERIQIRQGYALDGATSDVASAIASSFDWITRGNDEKHLRSGFLSAGNDGKLQYRYVDSSGTVSWNDLITGLSSVAYNYATYWNTSESLRECLFVNGASQIQAWNGAVTTLASATATTVTKNGTDTWSDAGFYVSTSGRSITINGVSATYSGGEGTATLTGVSVDFSSSPAGSLIMQGVVTTPNSAMTGITATFANGLISVLNNQIFVGSLVSSVVWISKVNSYTDYTSSTPRQSGEGASLILDSNIVAFIPQESYMYVSAGKDRWYNVSFSAQVSAAGVTYEQVNALPLKTGSQQGAQSQAFVSHMKNNIITVTNEPTIDMIGRLENYFGTPQTKNISDSIKLDVDSYDFTGGSIFYWRYYILVAIPAEGLVLMYNLSTNGWESPQNLPISRFYIVDGDLYGHSSQTSESYHMFTGYSDRVYPGFAGYPIDAIARFSYQNFGSRFTYKKANSLYVEGYINADTILECTVTYELDGCATSRTFEINGSDRQVVCIAGEEGSLGQISLGKIKLGGDSMASLTGLPPKFRAEKTFPSSNFFECSMTFEVLGTDNRFELLAFGLNAGAASEEPVSIRQ